MSELITEQRILELMHKQISSEVHERNVYRKLLEECLFTFEQLENNIMHNSNNVDTKKIAKKIEQTFNKYDISETLS